MGSKRRFKHNEDESNSTNFGTGSINVNKKFFKDKDNDEFKNCFNNRKETQSNDVNSIVKDLVAELVNITENEFIKDELISNNNELINNNNGLINNNNELINNNNELINDNNELINNNNKLINNNNQLINNNELASNEFSKSTRNQLDIQLDTDDSFKLNYNFGLNNNSADENSLFNNQPFQISLNDTLTSVEHNYANVSTTSSNHSNASNKLMKGAFKRSGSLANKKSVRFKGVNVFYFSRNQGGSTVPSQGGSTLGMQMNHCDLQSFTLDAYQEEKRKVHREILLRQKRFEKMYQKQQSNSNQSDSEDSLYNISDISDSELEFDSWYFLQPVPVKQRRALLRESGVNKIDSGEKEECRGIRQSREFCGCECESICDPETCLCSLNGIKCQVDRLNFPCGCLRDSCGNVNGRTEFNPLRVRTHFIHTIMRLELETRKNESQQFNETLNSSSAHHHHLKQNLNIEFMNQNNAVFSTLTSTANQQPIYNNESSNILNCNEVNELNLTSNEYLYDSGDSGSSTYSSENSECTSEELDCTLTNIEIDNNPAINGLAFNSLSPFSLISSTVPVATSNDILLNGGYTENGYHNFLNSDQSFRYYTATLNNTLMQQQTDPNSLVINSAETTTLNVQQQSQMINNGHHLNYQSYYSQPDTIYSNLNHLDHCYSATQQTDLSKLTMTYNSNDLQSQLEQPYYQEIHQYTDLSNLNQTIATSTTIINNEFVDCSSSSELINNSAIVNDDSSSSGRSINSNSDNYLTSSELTQNEEHNAENFCEIIKNTIVESVTA